MIGVEFSGVLVCVGASFGLNFFSDGFGKCCYLTLEGILCSSTSMEERGELTSVLIHNEEARKMQLASRNRVPLDKSN